MNRIQTKQGQEFKIFNNWLDCPHRKYCPKRGEREEMLNKPYHNLKKINCSVNPSMFDCEAYQKFNCQLGIPKIKNLNKL